MSRNKLRFGVVLFVGVQALSHAVAWADPSESSESDGQKLAEIMRLGTGSTFSRITPMGTNFEGAPFNLNLHGTMYMKHVGNSAVLPVTFAQFLADSNDEPKVASGSGLHLQKMEVKLYPLGNPSPEDINQHGLVDCGLTSVMAGLAYENPKFIKKIIVDHEDGTFSVTLRDPKGEPVTVRVDSKFLADSNGLLQAGGPNYTTPSWATVLEKAVMKYNDVYKLDSDPGLGGVPSYVAAPIFSGDGNSIAFAPGSLSDEQMNFLVEHELAGGKYITAGFNEVLPVGHESSNHLQDETVTYHYFTVLFPTNRQTLISMRNPWGASATTTQYAYDPSEDGLLNVPKSSSATRWNKIIDLRVIDPGAAAGRGITAATQISCPAGYASNSVGFCDLCASGYKRSNPQGSSQCVKAE